MKTFLMATAIAVAGTAALAQTAPPAPPVAPVRPMSDGVMTRAETVEKLRTHFSQLDTDRDGAITTAEVTAMHGKMAKHMEHGPGGPHVAFREGSRGDPSAAFDRLDANKDGAISRDEFAKGREIRVEKRIVMRDKVKESRKEGGMRKMRMHRMGGMGVGHMMAMADSNKDGRITLAEAETLALQHFDAMDTNRDGQVTRDERRAGHRMMIKKMHAPNAG